jgi:hypothetical protein
MYDFQYSIMCLLVRKARADGGVQATQLSLRAA